MSLEPKSPCVGCQYLSADKEACMFFIMMDVPFSEPMQLVDEFAEEDEGMGCPECCWALEGAKEMLHTHVDDLDDLIGNSDGDISTKELRSIWSLLKLALDWISILEKETEKEQEKGGQLGWRNAPNA